MKSEKKKLIPAISVFVFVAFSFVIANAFGDTYAASCPSGYDLTDGYCCPEGAIEYDTAYGGYCVANFVNSSTGECPDKYQAAGGLNDWYFTCIAKPVEEIDNESIPTAYTVTLIASGAEIDDYSKSPTASASDRYYAENVSEFDYGKYVASKGSNYEFIGWDRVSACNGPIKSGKMSNEVLSLNPTLYACFDENTSGDDSGDTETTYEVTFNPNGGTWSDGSTSSKEKKYTDKLYFSELEDISKSGFTFGGWKKSNGSVLNSHVDAAEDGSTLTAVWNAASSGDDSDDDTPPTTVTYDVTFYDEFKDEINTVKVNSGTSISSFPRFTYSQLDNYWSSDDSCSGEFNTSSKVTSNLELYQCYSEGFIVEFFDEYRESLTEVEVFPHEDYGLIPANMIPALNNGNDGFWSEYETCRNEFDVTDEIISEDLNLYACYTYDIYFYGLDENEEYEEIGSSIYSIGFTLYDVENVPGEDDLLIEGKVFTHWSTTSNSCEENYLFDPETELPLSPDGFNLYACYTAGEPVVVTFNGKDGRKITEMQVIKGTSINDTVEKTGVRIPNAPTVEGYTFKQWSSSTSCNKAYNFDSKVETELTLTACYTQNAATDDNVDENPGTGSFMLYIVFLIGILSLGYTGYYVYNVNKK